MSFKFQNKSCLIVIDIQNSYKDKIFDYEDFRKNIIKLLRKARKENIPICFVFEIDNENSHWIPFWEEMKGPRELDKGIPLKFCKPKENDFSSGALWKYSKIVGSARFGAVTHPGAKKEKKVFSDI